MRMHNYTVLGYFKWMKVLAVVRPSHLEYLYTAHPDTVGRFIIHQNSSFSYEHLHSKPAWIALINNFTGQKRSQSQDFKSCA